MSEETFGKIGQKVVHKNFDWVGVITDNVIKRRRITVDFSADPKCTASNGHNRDLEPRYVILIDTPNAAHVQNAKGWNFKVSAIQAIDWARMENDLTNSKPLLSVKLDMGNDRILNLVVVQRALLDKAAACKIKVPALKANMIDTDINVFQVRNHIAEWVTWGKKVKAAAWPKGMQTATVTAQQISV